MKYWIIMLALVASQAFAGANDEAIAQIKEQIAQLEQRIKESDQPLPRVQLEVWRLNNKLQALKDLNG
jgi:septal ring factor EnvC (AmiA/AmiB activator)